MSTQEMLDSVQDLKQDISMLDEQLDRFIELFEMVMAEQAFEEMLKILEELIIEQMNISNKIVNKTEDINELQIFQKNQIKDFDGLSTVISKHIPIISKFSPSSGMELQELLGSELVKKTN